MWAKRGNRPCPKKPLIVNSRSRFARYREEQSSRQKALPAHAIEEKCSSAAANRGVEHFRKRSCFLLSIFPTRGQLCMDATFFRSCRAGRRKSESNSNDAVMFGARAGL